MFSFNSKIDVDDSGCRYCNMRYRTIFADLNELEMNLLSTVKKCLVIKKGETVFVENTSPRFLFCIKSGKFKISRIGSDIKEQIVHLAQEGDVMGFRAILGDSKYNCTGISLEDSVICSIPKETFLSLVEGSPKLSTRVMQLLSEMLKETEIKLTVLGQNSVRDRLIHSLCLLIDKYGFESDGKTINLHIRRQEIANMAGTVRETATRILYDLENEKIIKLKEKKITILDYSQLLNHSNIF